MFRIIEISSKSSFRLNLITCCLFAAAANIVPWLTIVERTKDPAMMILTEKHNNATGFAVEKCPHNTVLRSSTKYD
jgi:hypothetical protein